MDARIALGINPLVIPDQSDSLRKAMTLQALQGQSQLQGLQLEEGQRTLGQNRAMDEAARGSTSTEDYLARLAKINPAAAIKMKGELLGSQKTQGEVYEQQSKAAQGLTAGFISLSPDQYAAAYPQFAAEWKRQGLPGADKVPEQFSPEMIPHLKMIAGRGLAPKDVQERADYAATGQPAAPAVSPVVAALSGAPQQPPMPTQPVDSADPASGAIVRRPQATPTLPATPIAQNAPPPPAEMQLPTEEVVGEQLSPDTPLELRKRAKALRQQGTGAGVKVAQDLEMEANRLEQRGLEDRRLDQQKKQGEEAIRVREEGIKVRQQNQGNQAKVNASKLSDDFRQEPAVKDYRTVQPLVASMQNASKKDTAASDLDMVYAIAKIFDPGSVVREGEQIMVVNAGGLPSKIQSALGFVTGGQRLSPTLRSELLDQAKSRADNYKQAYDSAVTSYTDQAKRWELDPRDIVREYKVTARGALAEGKGPIKQGAGAGTNADPFKIKGDDGYSAMPSGSFFIGPDGQLRVKP